MGLKQQFIKNYINLKIIYQEDGLMQLHTARLQQLSTDWQFYEDEIVPLFHILQGVNHVKVDYLQGTITIKYNSAQLSTSQVAKWVELFLNTLIENMEDIKEYWESDPDKLRNLITAKLKTQCAKVK
ncbi:MAG: hypothetical protein ATN36_08200 [Epulopiscium sp. Nele67-Bin005]|nr:MAG: hypothetical protein ATN36_08200 [Epulopiscium sp. Nele67-Bin005]